MSEVRIGVVGGSGLYSMDGLEVLEERVDRYAVKRVQLGAES